MKCPYCGRETQSETCEHCKAQIPVPAEKPKKTKEHEKKE